MNINKNILMPDGEQFVMAYPSNRILDALPISLETGRKDYLQLPKETVRSVILSCLNYSKPENIEDSLMVNAIGQEIVKSENEINLNDKMTKFLTDLLNDSILKEIKNKEGAKTQKGCYAGWIIVQVLEELNITNK
jgi:hypothetical protein